MIPCAEPGGRSGRHSLPRLAPVECHLDRSSKTSKRSALAEIYYERCFGNECSVQERGRDVALGQNRVGFSVFWPTMMFPTFGLSG
jgi:hypothetical protein